MNTEEYGICPYDSQHRILLFRMPGHILKCRKNYRGPPLEQCMYNATHMVPVGKLAQHEEGCRDCHLFNNSHYQKLAERCKPPAGN